MHAVCGTTQLPDAVVQEIVAKADGNPFFLEELAWYAVEHRGQHGLLQVPDTLETVLAARIDRLPADEKRLLQRAAVVGKDVPLPLLQALAALPEETLHRALGHLQAAELLYETARAPEPVYTFKHALTQEVAYGSLLQERRRGLHARIVETLETLEVEWLTEHVERLAHHAFRGEVWDKALTYCRQAGAKAATRSAYREAVMRFDQALEVLKHLPERQGTLEEAIELRLDLRSVLHPLGDIERIGDLLSEAEILTEPLGDQRRRGQVSTRICLFAFQIGDYGRSLAAGQRALAVGKALDDVRLHYEANTYLGMTYHMRGDYGRTRACLRTNVLSLEGVLFPQGGNPAGDPSVISRAWLSRSCAELGEFAEGIRHGEEGLQKAKAIDRPYDLVSALSGVGYLYLRQGNFPRAITVLEWGLSLCHDWHIQLLFPWIAFPLEVAYAQSGRVLEALRLLEQAVEQAVSMRFIAPLSSSVASQSVGYLRAGRLEEALPLAHRAHTLAREHQERGNQAWTLRLLGDLALHRDALDCKQAEIHYHQALALADELGMRPLQAHCHRGLGTVYSQTGRIEHARAELSTAIAMCRDMDMTFWLPEMKAMLAAVAGR